MGGNWQLEASQGEIGAASIAAPQSYDHLLASVALPLISVADVVVGEGDGYVDLVVRLSAPGQNVVTVNYATDFGSARAFGSDYESANGTLTFAIGETTKTVRVELSEDTTAEQLEHFRLNLSAVHNATLAKATAMVSIVNNDTVVATPNLFVRDVVVDEKAGTASFVVMLGGAAGQTGTNTLSVDYATSNGTAVAGSDYVAKSGTLVFAPGESVKTVVVNITDDALAEGLERFNLALSNASGATILDGLGVAEIGASDATAVALPLISVADVVVGEGDGYVDLVVRLSAPGQNVVTVNYATDFGSARAFGSDYESANGTLTFAIGETTKTVRVELSEDTTAEQLEHFRLNLSAVHNATLAKATAMVSIVNNDTVVATPNLFVRDVVVDEKAGTASFVVMLGGAAGQTGTNTLSVDYATSNGTAVAGSDYVAKSGTLVFAPGESVKTVVVNITDDALAEGLERFNLALSNASGATILNGLGVAEIGASDATAVALPLISVADVVVGEGDGYVDLVVRLSAPGQNVVTVNYATDFGSARAFGSDYESAMILDATYLRRDSRDEARALARDLGARFAVVDVLCPDAEVRERLRRRAAAGTDPSDAGAEVYEEQVRSQPSPSPGTRSATRSPPTPPTPPSGSRWRSSSGSRPPGYPGSGAGRRRAPRPPAPGGPGQTGTCWERRSRRGAQALDHPFAADPDHPAAGEAPREDPAGLPVARGPYIGSGPAVADHEVRVGGGEPRLPGRRARAAWAASRPRRGGPRGRPWPPGGAGCRRAPRGWRPPGRPRTAVTIVRGPTKRARSSMCPSVSSPTIPSPSQSTCRTPR